MKRIQVICTDKEHGYHRAWDPDQPEVFVTGGSDEIATIGLLLMQYSEHFGVQILELDALQQKKQFPRIKRSRRQKCGLPCSGLLPYSVLIEGFTCF